MTRHLQNGKLAGLDQEDAGRHQGEANDEHGGGRKVQRAKNEQFVPSTHCPQNASANAWKVFARAKGSTGSCTPDARLEKEYAGTAPGHPSSTDLPGAGCSAGADQPAKESPGVSRRQSRIDLRAKKPSSSSRRVGAGRGAPGFSWVGSLTWPSPKGFIRLQRGVCAVLTGISASLRLHPSEFMELRKLSDAISWCRR